MDLFSPLAGPRRRVAPLKAPGLPGLDVLPYVRGRLIFAHLAARVLSRRRYQQVLVDLPHFMNGPGWLEHPLTVLPMVSLAVFRRQDGELRAIPFGPHDAATVAVFLAGRQGLDLHCLDDSDLLNYPPDSVFAPELPVGDDYRVFQTGLSEFFDPLWARLDRDWQEAGENRRFFTRYRAQEVAKHLRKARKGKGRGLLVIEHQLWWALRQALAQPDQERIRYIFRWRQAPGVLRVEDPYFAWAQGLLDDYPALNLEFWQRLKSDRATGFDKLRSFEELLRRTLTSAPVQAGDRPAGPNVVFLEGYLKKLHKVLRKPPPTEEEAPPALRVSVRSLISFLRYLRNLAVIHQRLVPEPGSQFFHAARACGGRALHQTLAKAFLDYPTQLTGQQLGLLLKSSGVILIRGPGLELPGYEGIPSFYTGRPFSPALEPGAWPELDPEKEERQATCDLIHQAMTAEEKRALEEVQDYTRTRWAVKDDYRQHARASAYVRHLAQLKVRHFVPRRSWGAIEAGIHWKATLAAMARGEQALYVKHRTFIEALRLGMDEYTPVVLLLAPPEAIDRSYSYCVHDSNISQRNREMGNQDFPFHEHPPPDMVYSVFATTSNTDYFLEGHVHKEDLTSLAFLYTKELMGVDRYRAINRHRPGYPCRLTPDADAYLRKFPLSQRGVAWAVKYADNLVLVGAAYPWQPSAKLWDFAHQKRVKILSVNLAGLRPEFLDRLRRVFLLSTKLKKHPQREAIARRFIF